VVAVILGVSTLPAAACPLIFALAPTTVPFAITLPFAIILPAVELILPTTCKRSPTNVAIFATPPILISTLELL